MTNHHEALIYTMVLVSAADREMTDSEMLSIGDLVRYLPVFRDFDAEQLPRIAADCAGLLNDDDGLDRVIAVIDDSLPRSLVETAYALACDVAAADGTVQQEEARLLEILRHRLGLDRLCAAAIERASRARHATV